MILDFLWSMFSSKSKDVEAEEEEQTGGGKMMWRLFSIIVAVAAAYLSWRCNSSVGTGMPMKVGYAALSALFSHVYLAGYLVYRVVLGNKCGGL
jgi:hypothetical protein